MIRPPFAILPGMDLISNGESLTIGPEIGTNSSFLAWHGGSDRRSLHSALATRLSGIGCEMLYVDSAGVWWNSAIHAPVSRSSGWFAIHGPGTCRGTSSIADRIACTDCLVSVLTQHLHEALAVVCVVVRYEDLDRHGTGHCGV